MKAKTTKVASKKVIKKAIKKPKKKRHVEWYGWRPDMPDYRDVHYEPHPKILKKLPKKVDLKHHCPPVYNQGLLGSCTANAIAAAIQFGLRKQHPKHDFMPSRLFIYYNERVIEGTVRIDNGAEIRNGIKTVVKHGVCPEIFWNYSDDNKIFKKKPLPDCYEEALNHQVLSYHRLHKNLEHMKACLAEGFPFLFGFTVYEEFEGETIKKTGELNMPATHEKMKGGHAVMCVGYDEKSKRFIVRNSWDADWGQEGYFTMPYEYLTHPGLAEDFWTIRLVEIPE